METKGIKQLLATVSFTEEGKKRPNAETTLHETLIHYLQPDKTYKIGDTFNTTDGYKIEIEDISIRVLTETNENIYGVNFGYGLDQLAESNPYNFIVVIKGKVLKAPKKIA